MLYAIISQLKQTNETHGLWGQTDLGQVSDFLGLDLLIYKPGLMIVPSLRNGENSQGDCQMVNNF